MSFPSKLEKIGNKAFSESGLTSVKVSADQIGKYSFSKCNNLKSVVISNVSDINENAFEKCGNLTEVTVKNGTRTVGYGMFSDCKKLKTVSLSKSVKEIEGYAFDNCTGLSSISLKNVTEIGTSAFASCGLKKVTLSYLLSTIANNAFYGCKNMNTVNG